LSNEPSPCLDFDFIKSYSKIKMQDKTALKIRRVIKETP
jgi:hypothetical protein